jgi:hypothetical protein
MIFLLPLYHKCNKMADRRRLANTTKRITDQAKKALKDAFRSIGQFVSPTKGSRLDHPHLENQCSSNYFDEEADLRRSRKRIGCVF